MLLLPILNSRFKEAEAAQLEEEFRDLKRPAQTCCPRRESVQGDRQLLAAVTDENSNRYREAHERSWN